MDHDYIERHQVIDEYVMGRLPEAEADRFVDHYLTCDECLRRLHLAERFQQGLRDTVAEDVAAPVGLAAVLAALVRRRWTAGLTMITMIAMVAAAVLSWQILRLGRELDEARTRLAEAAGRQTREGQRSAAVEEELGELQQRLDAETQARSRLAEELARERRPRAGAAWLVALVPMRSGPATGEPAQRITLPPGADSIVLSLDMDLPGPDPYRVVLRRRDGQTVWTGERLSPGPAGTLAVGLDSALLPPGDYRLAVEQGAGAPVARFTFRVAR